MNKKIITFAVAITAFVAGFAGAYKVTVPLPSDFEGAMAYIVNYDTGARVDSVLVEDGVAEFVGTVAEPIAARLNVDGSNIGILILEDGEITYTPSNRTVTGGTLNEKNNAIQKELAAIVSSYEAADSESKKKEYIAAYDALTDKVLAENKDNVIGYIMFLDKAYEMDIAELEAYLAENPLFNKYARVQKLLKANRQKAATSEGQKFVDFEIEYNGETHKLSDVVGKGDYVLVDFWASWCGPCLKQLPVLKDLYENYGDKGLKVLGVAVWDEPENTLKAITQHDLPWECWINGQYVPTEAYGISGIPCIILFGPDGTILSRDKQGYELKAAVLEALNSKK